MYSEQRIHSNWNHYVLLIRYIFEGNDQVIKHTVCWTKSSITFRLEQGLSVLVTNGFYKQQRLPLVLQWYYSDTTVILQWYYSDTAVILQWYYSDTTVILRLLLVAAVSSLLPAAVLSAVAPSWMHTRQKYHQTVDPCTWNNQDIHTTNINAATKQNGPGWNSLFLFHESQEQLETWYGSSIIVRVCCVTLHGV